MAATTSGHGGGGGYTLPVIFYDGEQETHIGNINISPYTEFKSLQTLFSTKIGISPNQFTIFLKNQNHPSRKIPITSNINFSDVLQDTKCYFLVSLKRSRDRKNENFKENNYFLSPNVMLPRIRGHGVGGFYDMRLTSLNLGNTNVNVNERQQQQQRRGVFKDVVCEECLKGTAEIHLCVRDPVLAQPFRSPFGPVARPVKKLE